MNIKRSVIVLSSLSVGLGMAGCADDTGDDDDLIEGTLTGDLDPGAGGGLPGDAGDEDEGG